MNRIYYVIISFVIILLISTVYVSSTYLKQIAIHGISRVDDHAEYPTSIIKAENPILWKLDEKYNKFTINEKLRTQINDYQTTAFLVIQDNKIKYEEYFYPYKADSLFNSFSIAKSIVGILIGIAVDMNLISDVNDKVVKYLPELTDSSLKDLTIEHLLTMGSGLNWSEQYANPFSDVAEAYYGDNLNDLVLKKTLNEQPGKNWKYLSGNTQLLAVIIERVSKQSLAEFTEKNLWQKIGAEHFALWTLDKEKGTEKAFCCFHAIARDFARIGQIVLNQGKFNDVYIISNSYLTQMISPAKHLIFENKSVNFYGYQCWITYYKGLTIPYFRGILGQYIFIIPQKNAIIVRLGKKRTEDKINQTPKDAFIYLDAALEMLN